MDCAGGGGDDGLEEYSSGIGSGLGIGIVVVVVPCP